MYYVLSVVANHSTIGNAEYYVTLYTKYIQNTADKCGWGRGWGGLRYAVKYSVRRVMPYVCVA